MQLAGSTAGAGERDHRVLVRRPMGAALIGCFIETGLGEHLLRQLGMGRLARMGGAGKCDLAVPETTGIRSAAFHQRQRLDRLHGRAGENRPFNVADLQDGRAVRIDHRDRAAVPALHHFTAKHFHQHRICHSLTNMFGSSSAPLGN